MDQLMEMMVRYANNLEVLVTERTQLLFEEKQKTEDLLHRMLPKSVFLLLVVYIYLHCFLFGLPSLMVDIQWQTRG